MKIINITIEFFIARVRVGGGGGGGGRGVLDFKLPESRS